MGSIWRWQCTGFLVVRFRSHSNTAFPWSWNILHLMPTPSLCSHSYLTAARLNIARSSKASGGSWRVDWRWTTGMMRIWFWQSWPLGMAKYAPSLTLQRWVYHTADEWNHYEMDVHFLTSQSVAFLHSELPDKTSSFLLSDPLVVQIDYIHFVHCSCSCSCSSWLFVAV